MYGRPGGTAPRGGCAMGTRPHPHTPYRHGLHPTPPAAGRRAERGGGCGTGIRRTVPERARRTSWATTARKTRRRAGPPRRPGRDPGYRLPVTGYGLPVTGYRFGTARTPP
ncbi:hypothetical protein GCM10017667_68860 [Streptomyces filamentosus]|uniref:Uncharacterized protein n=1 Tax=Streptomyces filamentosus TaxID=67294 RepID=A0A919ERL9_STRFL|nr:hypothetical protein GCM10017667_38040 [Streptomyces filamentosus]GHG23664.1 hypothetical protein GCM10017667_68860 [Streptomyces filamentosus]